MEVFLHIGLHKTGTTTLQAVLNANHKQLGPQTALLNHNSDQLMPVQRACLAFARKRSPEAGQQIARSLATALQEAEASGAQKLIVSSEMLTGPVPAPHRLGGIAGSAVQIAPFLREGVSGHRAHFCLYTRDQTRWLVSLHAHLVRSRGVRITQSEFIAQTEARGFSIAQFAQDISDALGGAAIFKMEDDLGTRLGPGTQFLELAGFTGASMDRLAPVTAQNIGLSAQTVARMESPACMALPPFLRRYIARALERSVQAKRA